MDKKIRIAALQLSGPTPVNPGTSYDDKILIVKRLTNLVKNAAEEGVNIVCTNELALTPFFCKELIKENDYLFDSLPSPIIEPLIKEIKKNSIALILAYAEKEGIYHYNSAIIFDTDGALLGKYRKIHLPAPFPSNLRGGTGSYERLYFTPGNLGFPVFEIKSLDVRIGVQICYDRRFPEGSRILALKGADIIFYPTNYATYGQEHSVRVWGRCVQARAYENGLFVCIPNKAGTDDERENVGRSLIINPLGDIIVSGSPDKEEVVSAEINLAQVAEGKRRTPFWRDRRPEVYKELVQ